MVTRLDDMIVRGEIDNTSPNATYARLWFAGYDDPMKLELTGNAQPDLAGLRIFFTIKSTPVDHPVERDMSGISWRQIGPVLELTRAKRVQLAECSVDEYHERAKGGRPLPFVWKDALYLEWAGQNGPVALRVIDPTIRITGKGFGHPDVRESDIHPSPLQLEDDHLPDILEPLVGFDLPDQPLTIDDEGEDNERTTTVGEEEDEYQLFAVDIDSIFEEEATRLDRLIAFDEDCTQAVDDMELMDQLMETGSNVPISTIFDPPIQLPRPIDLDDETVDEPLTVLLSRLARHGIAIHVCPHFTMLEVYELLIDTICPQYGTYAELAGTEWVQHFSTGEFCIDCQDELACGESRDEKEPDYNWDYYPPEDEDFHDVYDDDSGITEDDIPF